MAVYILNIIVILIGGVIFLDRFRDEKAKKAYFFIVGTQLAIISGLRGHTVGPDTPNYVWFFENISSQSLNDILYGDVLIERGYLLLEYLVSKFSTDVTVFFLIVAVFFIASVSRFIYKNSTEVCLSFVLFAMLGFYTFSMTGIRQAIALGITLFSIDFIKKRKLVPFLLTVSLASTVHFSAVIFFPAYFLAYKKITKGYVLGTAIIIPASFILKGSIFSIMSGLSGYEYDPLSNEGPMVLIALMLMIFVGGFIQRESVLERNRDNLIFYNMSIMSIVIGMMTFVNPASLRAAYYYYIYMILFIPEIIMSISDKKLRRIVYAVSLIGVVFLGLRTLTPGSKFVPYLFFWQ